MSLNWLFSRQEGARALRRSTWVIGLCIIALLSSCSHPAPLASEAGAPAGAAAPAQTTLAPDVGSRAVGEKGMVSSAHPLASEAGVQMLKKGGNAVDAVVATAFALNVVEPEMSGIGGGGSMLIWLDEQERADYVDFYAAKRAQTYRDLDREAPGEGFNLLSTGVPGTVDGLLSALERHGTLSREVVMQPAIDLARDGFPVYLTLARFIEADSVKLSRYEEARETFWPGGEPLVPGERLRQPKLAETLTRIQQEGRSGFYEGEVAEAIVGMLNDAGNPITLDDLADYQAQWNKGVLCGSYHGYTVLSAPPPQSGAQVIETLGLLDRYQLEEIGLPTQSAKAFDILSSALRIGAADKGEYITDPRWDHVPATGMVSPAYAEKRGVLVGQGAVPDTIEAGAPGAFADQAPAAACSSFDVYNSTEGNWAMPPEHTVRDSSSAPSNSDQGETTHISVVDPEGNAASLSTTLSPVFGSGARVKGIMLNDSGYNFSSLEGEEEWASRHPYRTRASTISPTIILDGEKDVQLVIGAPGGGRIPTAIVQNIVFMLDYGMTPLEAVRMPRIFPSVTSDDVQVEDRFAGDVLEEARAMGYDPQALSPGYARLYLVRRQDGVWIGVSDPRHDGQPRGF